MDYKKVLSKFKHKNDTTKKKVDVFVEELDKCLKNHHIKSDVMVGGSYAKNTFLEGDHDIDIFVRFDKRYASDKLADYLERALKGFRYERLHGSRDYFQIRKGKLMFEIVPVYNITKTFEAVNITDTSPFHVEWLLQQIKHNPELCDQIRLTKLFCKTGGVYGAESFIRGFSGHVIDILTAYYGSFEKFVRAASIWSEKEVIDFYDYYKGSALQRMNKAKIDSPLIVVDPVQPNRNAAASLSKEKFNRFIRLCIKFLEKPSMRFFVKKEFLIKDVMQKYKNRKLIILMAAPLKGKRDVIGAKLLKVYEHIRDGLARQGFLLKGSGWNWESKNATLWYAFPKRNLSSTMEWRGPLMTQKENITKFKKRHDKVFTKNNRLYALKKRDYVAPEDFIRYTIKENFVVEKVRSCNIMKKDDF